MEKIKYSPKTGFSKFDENKIEIEEKTISLKECPRVFIENTTEELKYATSRCKYRNDDGTCHDPHGIAYIWGIARRMKPNINMDRIKKIKCAIREED